MPRCHVTGTEIDFSIAYVINRRAARHLIDDLEGRLAGSRRVLGESSPLDPAPSAGGGARPSNPARHVRHRMVCAAVSEALGAAFPEIELFVPWERYRQMVRALTAGHLKETPGWLEQSAPRNRTCAARPSTGATSSCCGSIHNAH